MATISILEFIVYGLIAYSSVLMLIISTIKRVPAETITDLTRNIWFLPGIFCLFIMSQAGVDILVTSSTTTEDVMNSSSLTLLTNSTTTHQEKIELQNPVWITIHIMLFLVMIVYVITNLVQVLTKTK